MQRNKYLFPLNKIGYIKDKNKDKQCILCGIVQHQNAELVLYQNSFLCITINLYPYNPGHLMIFPIRHIEDIRELTLEENNQIHLFTQKSLDLLDEVYHPGGYNLGYNIGKSSGASIAHIHLHIVPRYPNETGFIDILGGVKLLIETPQTTLERLKPLVEKYYGIP